MGNYTQPHTKAWARAVSKFDGFIFVTAEYNHSVPGALKNALVREQALAGGGRTTAALRFGLQGILL